MALKVRVPHTWSRGFKLRQDVAGGSIYMQDDLTILRLYVYKDLQIHTVCTCIDTLGEATSHFVYKYIYMISNILTCSKAVYVTMTSMNMCECTGHMFLPLFKVSTVMSQRLFGGIPGQFRSDKSFHRGFLGE